jgi:hypothetical protein
VYFGHGFIWFIILVAFAEEPHSACRAPGPAACRCFCHARLAYCSASFTRTTKRLQDDIFATSLTVFIMFALSLLYLLYYYIYYIWLYLLFIIVYYIYYVYYIYLFVIFHYVYYISFIVFTAGRAVYYISLAAYRHGGLVTGLISRAWSAWSWPTAASMSIDGSVKAWSASRCFTAWPAHAAHFMASRSLVMPVIPAAYRPIAAGSLWFYLWLIGVFPGHSLVIFYCGFHFAAHCASLRFYIFAVLLAFVAGLAGGRHIIAIVVYWPYCAHYRSGLVIFGRLDGDDHIYYID